MATLGLSMIVGPGEAAELHRCLEVFKVQETFHETVVCCTTEDPDVHAAATKHATRVLVKPWTSTEFPYGDFGGARNVGLDANTTDYVMWLDADDICTTVGQSKLPELKKLVDQHENIDVYMMPYDVVTDYNGRAVHTFQRERIFRRCGRYRWIRPVHEIIPFDPIGDVVGCINNLHIVHAPAKPYATSAMRNLAILEHEVKTKGNADPGLRYFYGRDMMMSGRTEEGLAIFEAIVNEMEEPADKLYAICMDIAYWHAFGGQVYRPAPDQIPEEKRELVECWLRRAIAFYDGCAEPFMLLGDIYAHRGYLDRCAEMYKAAMGKKIGKALAQIATYYEELPSDRLSRYYLGRHELERALFYNSRALLHASDNDEYRDRRRIILDLLIADAEEKAA